MDVFRFFVYFRLFFSSLSDLLLDTRVCTLRYTRRHPVHSGTLRRAGRNTPSRPAHSPPFQDFLAPYYTHMLRPFHPSHACLWTQTCVCTWQVHGHSLRPQQHAMAFSLINTLNCTSFFSLYSSLLVQLGHASSIMDYRTALAHAVRHTLHAPPSAARTNGLFTLFPPRTARHATTPGFDERRCVCAHTQAYYRTMAALWFRSLGHFVTFRCVAVLYAFVILFC